MQWLEQRSGAEAVGERLLGVKTMTRARALGHRDSWGKRLLEGVINKRGGGGQKKGLQQGNCRGQMKQRRQRQGQAAADQ